MALYTGECTFFLSASILWQYKEKMRHLLTKRRAWASHQLCQHLDHRLPQLHTVTISVAGATQPMVFISCILYLYIETQKYVRVKISSGDRDVYQICPKSKMIICKFSLMKSKHTFNVYCLLWIFIKITFNLFIYLNSLKICR
jgi:hypothetical protein